MPTDETLPPQYLYHYTSIEVLALILKTKKIRLQRLDKVNDPTEELSKDGKLGKYVFVTCWTSQDQEVLPFWYMYGHNKRGVRVRLASNFIRSYRLSIPSTDGGILHSIIPEKRMLGADHLVLNSIAAPNNRFIQVEYTDDSELLMPSIFRTEENGALTMALGKLGKHKPTIWSFEKEWRYRLLIFPMGFQDILQDLDSDDPSTIRHAIETQQELNFDEYFLDISDETYVQMEITLGPSCTEGDRTIVDALIQKYNPSALLVPSVCKVR